jgi:hypothetical protein
MACADLQPMHGIVGLKAFRGDTGDWVYVGSAKLSSEDSKRLAHEGEPTGMIHALVNGTEGRTKHLVTKGEWGDIKAKVEWMVPQGSNSGVYLQGRYEIQVLDSWGVEEPKHSDAGGIYQRWNRQTESGYEGIPPKVNASKKPGEWQSFEIWFRAPRFDADGKKTAPAAFVKVLHNGQLVHDYTELSGPTRSAMFGNEKAKGPLMLQGNHGPVAYRNIQMVPADFSETIETKKAPE